MFLLGGFRGIGEQDKLAEIAEGGGSAGGDFVGGHGPEDLLESAMNVDVAGFGIDKF